MLGWSLPSNSGRFRAIWSVTASSRDHITCDFQLFARSYNSEVRDPLESDNQLVFVFPGLVVSVIELTRFAADLERWCQLPLVALRDTPLLAEANLGGRFDEYLLLRFGADPAKVPERHPFALFEYTVAGVSGRFSYATDQTCVGSLLAGIASVLNDPAA